MAPKWGIPTRSIVQSSFWSITYQILSLVAYHPDAAVAIAATLERVRDPSLRSYNSWASGSDAACLSLLRCHTPDRVAIESARSDYSQTHPGPAIHNKGPAPAWAALLATAPVSVFAHNVPSPSRTNYIASKAHIPSSSRSRGSQGMLSCAIFALP